MTEGPGMTASGRAALAVLMLALAAGLAAAVLALPEHAPGLSDTVAAAVPASGVSNPVTAVLLNFRAWDTLLEMAVLLLAPMGAWALAIAPADTVPARPMLRLFSRLVVPLMILVAGFLLWEGAHAPGGAFQAGAVLAAAGVLLRLADGRPLPAGHGPEVRSVLALGLATFVGVAAVLLLAGGRLLEYPPGLAGGLILLIESAAALSIAAALVALFHGAPPGGSRP